MAKGDKARKDEYFTRVTDLFKKYKKILVVGADNVSSQQFHNIRRTLRGKGVVLMGKNTLIRKAIRSIISEYPALDKLIPNIKGNVGLVFTEGDLREVRKICISERVEAPARAGAIAPVDVFIPALNTGMGPEKTSFFQALGIATKITKGTIEILNDVHLIKSNEKVGPSEATLLNMLKMSPFTYGLVVETVYDNGSVFPSALLDITDDVLLERLSQSIRNVAAISIQLGFPTIASVPHSLINGFKNVLSIGLGTEFTFKQVDKVKELMSKAASAPAAAPAAAAPKAAAAAAPAKKEEPKEESDEDMGFGLFD